MTDKIAGASSLLSIRGEIGANLKHEVLNQFYEGAVRLNSDIVMDKWFALQASSQSTELLGQVQV